MISMDLKHRQRGMALLVSLVFLLLLTLIGLSSMQSATLQEKMTSSVMQRNQSFQIAEAALRMGECGAGRDLFLASLYHHDPMRAAGQVGDHHGGGAQFVVGGALGYRCRRVLWRAEHRHYACGGQRAGQYLGDAVPDHGGGGGGQ